MNSPLAVVNDPNARVDSRCGAFLHELANGLTEVHSFLGAGFADLDLADLLTRAGPCGERVGIGSGDAPQRRVQQSLSDTSVALPLRDENRLFVAA